MSHTPTPWRLGTEIDGEVYNPSQICQVGTTAVIAQVYEISLNRTLSELLSRDSKGLANAQFIVRAVNAHDELLAAAEAVLAHVENEQLPRVGSQCTLCHTYRAMLRTAIQKAKA